MHASFTFTSWTLKMECYNNIIIIFLLLSLLLTIIVISIAVVLLLFLFLIFILTLTLRFTELWLLERPAHLKVLNMNRDHFCLPYISISFNFTAHFDFSFHSLGWIANVTLDLEWSVPIWETPPLYPLPS